jgi:hypothetical protein
MNSCEELWKVVKSRTMIRAFGRQENSRVERYVTRVSLRGAQSLPLMILQ